MTETTQVLTQAIPSNWTHLDTLVVLGYLAVTTLIGALLSGKQHSIRDFFLGGRRLPWWAVSASIISTEISAVTFVSLPALVARDGGNFTYLQIGLLGYLLARITVAVFFIPLYYKQEIYSPYDFLGQRLGNPARIAATILFSISGLLAQGARLYLTALILEVIMGPQLAAWAAPLGMDAITLAIWIIGIISIGWTLIGGVNTVIWTDVILVAVFLTGALVALFVISTGLPGGPLQVLETGQAAGKFQLWNSSLDFTNPFTVLSAVVAGFVVGLAAFGLDQMMIQRAFCCRNINSARLAIISSHVGIIVPILVMLVGVGLWAHYQQYPMTGAVKAAYDQKQDRIFPLFILTEMPTGIVGLLMAAIFAAAINGSILTALAQTTIAIAEKPLRQLLRHNADLDEPTRLKQAVTVSRWLVAVWGLALCAVGMLVREIADANPTAAFLNIALEMSTYCMGALLGGFFLALMGKRIDGTGFLFAAPLAVVTVFALRWHDNWAITATILAAALLLTLWLIYNLTRPVDGAKFLLKTIALSLGTGLPVLLSIYAITETNKVLAWPWYTTVGTLVTVVLGYLLSSPPLTPANTPR
jgi:Na+/proline symporter